MSQYSVLNGKEISEICNRYGTKTVKSFSILSGGSENTNYLITTQDKQFVLTICEQKTMQSARELSLLLEHLAIHHFETSKLVRTKDHEPISKWKGKPIMLKIFLEGEIIKDLSLPILETIGMEIGRLHQIEAPSYVPKELGYGMPFFNQVSQYASGSTFERWLLEMKAYFQPFISEKLPKSLIHSDIFYSNIVVSSADSRTYIMDFEEAANYYRIFDIGMTLVGLCCPTKNLNVKMARTLLKGYQQKIELQEVEKRSLQAFAVYAATSMTFWRHRNFNHVNPDPEMYDHYLGLKVIADSIREIPADTFKEIIT